MAPDDTEAPPSTLMGQWQGQRAHDEERGREGGARARKKRDWRRRVAGARGAVRGHEGDAGRGGGRGLVVATKKRGGPGSAEAAPAVHTSVVKVTAAVAIWPAFTLSIFRPRSSCT